MQWRSSAFYMKKLLLFCWSFRPWCCLGLSYDLFSLFVVCYALSCIPLTSPTPFLSPFHSIFHLHAVLCSSADHSSAWFEVDEQRTASAAFPFSLFAFSGLFLRFALHSISIFCFNLRLVLIALLCLVTYHHVPCKYCTLSTEPLTSMVSIVSTFHPWRSPPPNVIIPSADGSVAWHPL